MRDQERWQRIQAVFHELADLDSATRLTRLEQIASSDATLAAEVRALLEADDAGASILDRGVAGTADALLSHSTSEPLPAEQFGPYRVTSLLGEGGMGVVYLGVRDDLGSEAAIKILRDSWLSPARRERFASEQRTLALLKHPGIAALYDAGTLPDGTPWFVMEYIAGVSLAEYVREHKLSVRDRLRLVRDLCAAVQYAHAHAVIHRDIKPSNILVTAEGQIKLLDFGISKQLGSAERPADQTRSGVRLLTPAYAAPEQIRGGATSAATDVYSIGVVLYELLAGRLPFELSQYTPGEAVNVLVTEEPTRPSVAAHYAGTSRREWQELDVLIQTAMHRDLARRYATVEALLRDLDHFLAGEPLDAHGDSASYRAGLFVRRHRAAVGAGISAFVLIAAVVALYTIRLGRARDLAIAEAERTNRIQAFMVQLFQGGDEAAGPADSLRVTSLLDQGVKEAQALANEPAVQADLYLTLGRVYQQLGQFERADSLLSLATSRQLTLHGQGSKEVAASQIALGRLRVEQARIDEAEALIREGLATLRAISPSGGPVVVRGLSALGKALRENGKYDSSIAVLDTAVAMHRSNDSVTADYTAALTELANSHFQAGHYPIADSINRLVLPLERRLHGYGHPLVAELLLNLGAIQLDEGRYPQAEAYDREALALYRAWYGNDHPQTASALTMLGRALVYERKDSAAVDALQQAVGIQERVFGKVHPRVASAVNELGNLALQQGRLDDAEAAFRRMVSIYREVYHDNHYLIGIALSNLASVFSARMDFAGAEVTYRDALARFTQALGPNHTNTGIARVKLGRTLLRQRRFAEAIKESEAGYFVLASQTDEGTSFLQAARKDIAASWDTLGSPGKGAKYKADWERINKAQAKKP